MIKDKAFQRPAMWMHPRLWTRRILQSWPFLIWLALIVVVAFLYGATNQFTAMTGVVETIRESASPLETARLSEIRVKVGQRVKAGDVLATMDTSMLDIEAAIDEARVVEAEGTIMSFQQRLLAFDHDFETEIRDTEFSIETEKMNQRRDISVLTLLRKERDRLEGMLADGLVGEDELTALRSEIAALEEAVESYPGLIDIHERRLSATRKNRSIMKELLLAGHPHDADLLTVISGYRSRNERLFGTFDARHALQRQQYSLRATGDRVVSEIFYRAGDVVNAGEPVMRLVSEVSDHVVGFLPEIHIGHMFVGQETKISRRAADGTSLSAVVESISPDVRALPGRISPIGGQTLRGRRVVLRITDSGAHLIPGETVNIQLTVSRWSVFIKTLFSSGE